MWIWSCHFDTSWLFCLLVDAVSSLCQWSLPMVRFWSGWYWLFLSLFSASFRSSCKVGVHEISQQLLVCKGFYFSFPYEAWFDRIWNSRLKECWILAPTLFWLVGFLPRDPLWFWWASLCEWPDLSFWLLLVFSPLFQPWWIWWLGALGLLFFRSISVVFFVFSVFECWPALLGWGSSG